MKMNLTKMSIDLDTTKWHGESREVIWVERLIGAKQDDLYVVQNSPFFARGISYLDIVRGVNQNIYLEFVGLVSECGHSTYRIICDTDSSEFSEWWQKLEILGCSYEGAIWHGRSLYAVDVPEEVDINKIYVILEEAQNKDIWIFEEAHFGKNGRIN